VKIILNSSKQKKVNSEYRCHVINSDRHHIINSVEQCLWCSRFLKTLLVEGSWYLIPLKQHEYYRRNCYTHTHRSDPYPVSPSSLWLPAPREVEKACSDPDEFVDYVLLLVACVGNHRRHRANCFTSPLLAAIEIAEECRGQPKKAWSVSLRSRGGARNWR
jgi:hypothetical protein